MPNKIILLDSNSLVHRAYHALPNLRSSKGVYTGAIYGFLSILLRLIKEQQPTHIAAAFDLKAPTFRHKMFEAYKGTRKPMDDELRQQFEPLKELLTAMGIKIVSLEGYEADDILGTLSKRFEDDTIIVTGDRDSFQLVDDSTKIFWTKKGVSEIEVYDEAHLLADGFTVASFIDYKALRGDPSDNIPGVYGVGEKTAMQLLQQFGSLDNVLEHASEVKGKVGETLQNSRDIALLSRELATIKLDVPVECTLEDIVFQPCFSAEVKQSLIDLDMTSILNRMVFDVEIEKNVPQEIEKTICEIKKLDELEKALKGTRVALLINDNIRFAVDEKTEYVVSCIEDLFSEGLSFDESIEEIKKHIKKKELVCFDAKSLSKKFDFDLDNFFDLMIAAHLAQESVPIRTLDAMLGMYNLQVGACEMLVACDKLKTILKEKELDKLFFEIEQPLAVTLKNMEQRGFCVSSSALDILKTKYSKILESLTAEIYEKAEFTFNIGSPKQLGEVLFDRLGLKHGKKTKTGYSVGEEVLVKLKNEHAIIPLILEWRHFAKLQSTYVLGLQPLVSRGKIYTEFNQCITTTGRLSSTNPNLQNIPVKGDEAKDIKSAFKASHDSVLVSADYSQIELRLLAHFSEDKMLIDAYNRAEDIHALTASQILGIPISQVTPAERRDAKAVNFGIVYGMSDFGLSENISIPVYKAKMFIEKYFQSYPTVKAYLDKCISDARERGYAITMLGRRRKLADINASNYLVRSSAERMAMNTPLQGSAADIVKLAMLKVEERLENMKSKMILQIHDELVIDTAKDEIEEVKNILEQEMENVVKLKVPLVVETSVADNWGEL